MKHFTNNKKRIFVSELFQEVDKASNDGERKEILQEYVSMGNLHYNTLRKVVETIFHPDVVMNLPGGIPPYEEFKDGPSQEFGPRSIFNAVNMVPRFVKGQPDYIVKDIKRETYFIKALESMHPLESKIFIMMKEKKIIDHDGITEKLFMETFSDWLPEKKAGPVGAQKNEKKEEAVEKKTETPAKKKRTTAAAAKKKTNSASTTTKKKTTKTTAAKKSDDSSEESSENSSKK